MTSAPPREKVPSEGLEPRTTSVQRSPPREPPPGVDGVTGQAPASGALAVFGPTPPSAASGPGEASSPVLAAEAPHPTAPPPPLGEAAQTLLLLAMTDVSLGVDVHQQVVNVVLQTEAAGPLELELRLHEGRAHVTVEGPGSPLLAQHAPALREVLSREGLSLGEFSTPQGDRPRQEEREDEAAGPSVSAPSPRRRHEGRIDVEA
ncbi:MAG: flagellar hook-length control protein FliK [Myxococcales bacterium]|nr:flagellar hook-length control protein FliK [Myxococcales bacterium]